MLENKFNLVEVENMKYLLTKNKCWGLCTYCAKKDTCSYHKSKGYVSFCDNYDNGWW